MRVCIEDGHTEISALQTQVADSLCQSNCTGRISSSAVQSEDEDAFVLELTGKLTEKVAGEQLSGNTFGVTTPMMAFTLWNMIIRQRRSAGW